MKKILTLFLCFALICSLSVSSFAAGAPEPIFSLEFSCSVSDSDDNPIVLNTFVYDGIGFTDGKLYYVDFNGVFYETVAMHDYNEEEGYEFYYLGNVNGFFGGGFTEDLPFLISFSCSTGSDYVSVFAHPYSLCSDGEHSHSFAVYDENPFGSSAPVSDTPAFITATSDGFKVMNSIIAGIMSNPVLLFLLAASLIPVGIALFRALKNAASRK